MRTYSYKAGSFHTRQVAGGAGEIELLDVMTRADFETPIEFIRTCWLPPGTSVGRHLHEGADECLVMLTGALTIARDGESAVVDSPAVALCPAGDVHGVANHTAEPQTLIAIAVAAPGRSFESIELGDDLSRSEPTRVSLPDVAELDRSLLSPVNAHGGLGEIAFRRLFDHDAFRSNWGFLDHALLPSGTSVGYHRHETVQECYVILDGRGRMKVDGVVGDVAAGDCIPNRLGGSHGIINDSDRALEFLNVAVFLEKGRFDATDLGDDLGDLE